MNGRGKKWLKQIGTGLMILAIGIMLINKAAYTHVHILSNGSLVTHAHPLSNSAESKKNTSHQHSSLELFLLDSLEILILCAPAAFILKRSASTLLFRELAPQPLIPVQVPVLPGRAPPTSM